MHLKVGSWRRPSSCTGPAPTVGLERVALFSATVPARLPARDNAGLERFWRRASPQGLAQILPAVA